MISYLLKLKNISFDIMQFVNDMSPQFVNYRLSPFFSFFFYAITHVLFVYKKFREILSRHQLKCTILKKKFIIQAKPHSKQNYFHFFFNKKKKKNSNSNLSIL
jgi:hypothetical protein